MASFRAAVLVTLFVLLTLLCLPVQFLLLRLSASGRRDFPTFYHRLVCRLMGARVRVVGTPLKGGGLMAANHAGWLDIPFLSSVLPVSFIAKSEVGTWAFFGTLARLQRTIFVRRDRAKAGEDRDQIARRLREGSTLVIFPEGTSSDGNRVLGFKSALFSAAELALDEGGLTHPQVQPVSISYVGLYGMPMGRENRPFYAWYGDMELVPHLWEAFATGPIDVVIEFHEPLRIEDAKDRKKLAFLAEQNVRDGVTRALSGQGAVAQPVKDEALIEALDAADEDEAA